MKFHLWNRVEDTLTFKLGITVIVNIVITNIDEARKNDGSAFQKPLAAKLPSSPLTIMLLRLHTHITINFDLILIITL